MPSGKTHERIGLITMAGAGAFTLLSPLVPAEAKIPIVLGLAFGIILTPDVDLSTRTHEERRMQNIPIFGQLWIEHWASYGWRFKHRGLSHIPVLGTLTRLFWIFKPLLWMVALLAILVAGDIIVIGWVNKPGQVDWTWFPWFFLGWTFQDLMHEIADVLVSEHKMKMKERKL